MASLIKKNKNLVSKIMKDMKKYSEKSFVYGHSAYLPDEAYNISPSITSNLTYRFRAVEDDTCIYIGYDLTAPYTITYNSASYGNSLYDLVKHKAFPRWGSGNEYLIKAIGHTREEIENDISLLDKIVAEVDKHIKKLLDSSTVEYTLRDKQFPKLKDRKILPLVIIDTTNGTVNFCHDRYANTYRQSRTVLEIDDFKLNKVGTAVNSLSLPLFVDIVFSCPSGYRVVS